MFVEVFPFNQAIEKKFLRRTFYSIAYTHTQRQYYTGEVAT